MTHLIAEELILIPKKNPCEITSEEAGTNVIDERILATNFLATQRTLAALARSFRVSWNARVYLAGKTPPSSLTLASAQASVSRGEEGNLAEIARRKEINVGRRNEARACHTRGL